MNSCYDESIIDNNKIDSNKKNCPSCHTEQVYFSKSSFNYALKNNSECRKCCQKTNIKKLMGKPAWNRGKHHSIETRKKLSLAHMGKVANNRLRPYEYLFNRLKRISKEIGCDLTYEDFLEFTKIDKCHYCNEPIDWQPVDLGRKKRTHRYNLDRIDSNKGYTKENCVVCCKRCNQVKSNIFTCQQMLKLGPFVKSLLEK